jgi:serine/threonine protein kinase
MPVPTTTDDLLDLIHKSELVPAERLETFMNQSGSSASKPRELMNLLVAAGLVSQFQAEQLLQGKWRGFTLGKYKVLERLGSGGMGTVYLCEHMVVCRKVAVKVLPTSQASNPSALGRFYREARAAGVLDHPNLVKAHDVDQEGQLHFLVMDYIDGASLQEIVTRFGPLSVPRACHYIRQAATGLQAAHEAGLIHRDVKPANIMLERNGTIRVLDLGLARFRTDIDMLTLKYDEKNVLGTADYVAPEQALNSHDVDIRCDIYGLGGTFYYLLTGSPPFPGGKVAQKLIWHQVRQPTPVRATRGDVPEELEAVIGRMMAKDPADRFQSPREVIAALATWTKTPVPPPRDEEMPRLSPAAAAVASGPASPCSRPQVRRARRSSNPATAHRPAVAAEQETNGHVSTLHRAPAGMTEAATPRDLASPQSATDTALPRARTAAVPSRLLEKATAHLAANGGVASLARLVLLAVLSGVAGGMALWLVLR